MNPNPEMILEPKSEMTRGSDQASSSVVLRLNPSKRNPTAPTRVTEPSTSIRCNFSDNDWFRTLEGSRMLTLVMTRIKLKIKTGACGLASAWSQNTIWWKCFYLHEKGSPPAAEWAKSLLKDWHTYQPNVSCTQPPRGPPKPAPSPNNLYRVSRQSIMKQKNQITCLPSPDTVPVVSYRRKKMVRDSRLMGSLELLTMGWSLKRLCSRLKHTLINLLLIIGFLG